MRGVVFRVRRVTEHFVRDLDRILLRRRSAVVVSRGWKCLQYRLGFFLGDGDRARSTRYTVCYGVSRLDSKLAVLRSYPWVYIVAEMKSCWSVTYCCRCKFVDDVGREYEVEEVTLYRKLKRKLLKSGELGDGELRALKSLVYTAEDFAAFLAGIVDSDGCIDDYGIQICIKRDTVEGRIVKAVFDLHGIPYTIISRYHYFHLSKSRKLLDDVLPYALKFVESPEKKAKIQLLVDASKVTSPRKAFTIRDLLQSIRLVYYPKQHMCYLVFHAKINSPKFCLLTTLLRQYGIEFIVNAERKILIPFKQEPENLTKLLKLYKRYNLMIPEPLKEALKIVQERKL
ncbi:MAG: hypothetical protein DRJ40_07500 [Thermoprotei archaeon]|nr:MAG: hypothetical protein DRJ40_07500 [Thermoprotei archaeon]